MLPDELPGSSTRRPARRRPLATLGRTVLALALLSIVPASQAGAQVRVGIIAGYSFLERTDTGLTHGRLVDTVTLGRSLLVGAAVDARIRDRHSLGGEFVYGPYGGDVHEWCVTQWDAQGHESCPMHRESMSWALAFGAQYRYRFGGGAWKPFAGAGAGLKLYSETLDTASGASNVAWTFSGSFGVESSGRVPVQIEFRTVYLTGHPFLMPDYYKATTPVELQARLTVFFPTRRQP